MVGISSGMRVTERTERGKRKGGRRVGEAETIKKWGKPVSGRRRRNKINNCRPEVTFKNMWKCVSGKDKERKRKRTTKYKRKMEIARAVTAAAKQQC